jgi:hypothetical protein
VPASFVQKSPPWPPAGRFEKLEFGWISQKRFNYHRNQENLFSRLHAGWINRNFTEKEYNFCMNKWPLFFFFLQAPPQWAVGGAHWAGAGEQVPLPGNLWWAAAAPPALHDLSPPSSFEQETILINQHWKATIVCCRIVLLTIVQELAT